MTSRTLALVVAAALFGVSACKKAEPPPPLPPPTQPGATAVRVTEVQVGNAVGADKRVTAPSTTLSTKDTIFASVVTEGAAPAVQLKARWTFQDGQVVNETTRSIAPAGKEVTEFSIAKADGWPAGQYKVEISLDGHPAETRAFRVQ
jgi:hypothetical protein